VVEVPWVNWWMYLLMAAGALVLFNVLIVVLLATLSRSERDPADG